MGALLAKLLRFASRLFTSAPLRGAKAGSLNRAEIGLLTAQSSVVLLVIAILQIVLDAVLGLPLSEQQIAIVAVVGTALIASLQAYARWRQGDLAPPPSPDPADRSRDPKGTRPEDN